MQYEAFITFFAVAMFSYGLMTQADRRARSSLEGAVFGNMGVGLVLQGLGLLGQIGWLALVVLGFMSIAWYWVIGIFLLAGSAGGIGYTLATIRPDFHAGVLHNYAAGISGLIVGGLTLYMWGHRLTWL